MPDDAPSPDLLQSLAQALIVAGVALTVIAPMVLAVEVGEWLTNSEWPGWSLADGLSALGFSPEFDWTRAQHLLDVAATLPLTIALFCGGTAAFLAGVNLSEWDIERRRDAPSGRRARP